MNPTMLGLPDLSGVRRVMSNRDLLALALSAGYKIAGGHWLEAFGLGLVARILMHEFNYPPLLPASEDVQFFARQAGAQIGSDQGDAFE